MGLTKKESEVKTVALPVNMVYTMYSDLSNFEKFKTAVEQPEVRDKIKSQGGVSDEKLDEMAAKLEQVSFTADTIVAPSPMGEITLRVVEREENRLIKLASEGAPMQFYVWVQFLPHTVQSTRLKVTCGADVNMIMKAMVKKPLQQAADGLAQMLAGVTPPVETSHEDFEEITE